MAKAMMYHEGKWIKSKVKEQDMTVEEALKEIVENGIELGAGDYVDVKALKVARKALDAQIKLKEYIERINQPEYKDVVWQKDEVVLLLQELVAR